MRLMAAITVPFGQVVVAVTVPPVQLMAAVTVPPVRLVAASPDGSAKLLDPDQVARGITEGQEGVRVVVREEDRVGMARSIAIRLGAARRPALLDS
ncbi:hypothetical protein F4562_003774 [Streptosporangium becharense]|uniref:Uncharacterized protein n=1 Tax=Streptosporangium becharense TaxID=1816182 RepID=A0A7W9IH61_9ACTN|nr:hypothetical protein [Streptosporangium becharense]MBB5820712.1 hypothetical protein [Streptosporangium becharense]